MRTAIIIVIVGVFGAGILAWLLLTPRLVPAVVPPMTVPIPGSTKPSPTLSKTPATILHFTNQLTDSGIDFVHHTGDSPVKPFPAANGSGIAAFDMDGDGWCDLYFATGTDFPLDKDRSAPLNRLYRNMGAWKFQEATGTSGLGFNGYTAGIAVADYDNDGFCDVFLCCYGPDVLYRNQGDGTFSRQEQTGVEDPAWGTSAAFLDADGDGNLELYTGNYGKWTLETNRFCGDQERKIRIFCNPQSEEPAPDGFFHNESTGTFRDIAEESGIRSRMGRAQGVLAADLDQDGTIDIYVSNDLNANSLFMHTEGYNYRDATEFSGAGYDAKGQVHAGMGIAFGDVNNDGQFDLMVTNFQHEHNTLFENLGGGLFQESSARRGVSAPSMPWVGWGTTFTDFDLDGWLDSIVTNGHPDTNLKEYGTAGETEQPPLLLRNEKGRFEQIPNVVAGEYFTKVYPGRALVVWDGDRDGAPDVVIGHQDKAPALLKNDTPALGDNLQKNSVTLQLVATRGNRSAIGAIVHWSAGESKQTRQIVNGGSYLSVCEENLIFACPPGVTGGVEIRWPGGAKTTIPGLKSGGRYLIIEDRPNAIELP